MRKSAQQTIRELEMRIAKLERSSGIFQKAPRQPTPKNLTLISSEGGYHVFQSTGGATITYDDIKSAIRRSLVYIPSSQWTMMELDLEAQRYSRGKYEDFGSYRTAFYKLFNRIVEGQINISTSRDEDTIRVFFNPQGIEAQFALILRHGLHFLLKSEARKNRSHISETVDEAIRSLGAPKI